jgi:hypothetical protein
MHRSAFRMLALTPPLIGLILIGGCATVPSNPPVICPAVQAYSRDFQTRLADELAGLPKGAALETAMLDYARLRDEVRACAGKAQARAE